VDQICLVAPLREGKADAARAFLHDLDGSRRDEYDRSEQRIGITKEVWFLAQAAGGDQLVGYMESPDFNSAFTQFVGSRDEFDLWFKERFADVTASISTTRRRCSCQNCSLRTRRARPVPRTPKSRADQRRRRRARSPRGLPKLGFHAAAGF
jgi:hypothetical protein